MQEELKNVLTLFRERRRNLDIVKTPEIFIQQTSNPVEVEKWLTAKGFSERTVKKLHGLSGNELFALKRHTLEEYCGTEEGKRLASQITIQRNVSGVRSKFSGKPKKNSNFIFFCSIKPRDRLNFKQFWRKHVKKVNRKLFKNSRKSANAS
jgi:SAM domain (Sterile alpha motif)